MENDSNQQIIHQPIYERRKNRLLRNLHQLERTTNSNFSVIQPTTVVGAQSITHFSNNTVHYNGGFKRDGKVYGPPEKSNPPIYPNISKTYKNFRSRGASISRLGPDDSFNNSNFLFRARANSCVRESVNYPDENNAFVKRQNRSRSSKNYFVLLNDLVLIILRIK